MKKIDFTKIAATIVASLNHHRDTGRDDKFNIEDTAQYLQRELDPVKKPPKWIEFAIVPMPPDRKTNVFKVINKERGICIGEVKWFGSFRKYSFFPEPNMVFESTCMQDITDFLNQLMEEWKTAKGIIIKNAHPTTIADAASTALRETHETWNDPHKMVKVSDDPLNFERREIEPIHFQYSDKKIEKEVGGRTESPMHNPLALE